MLLQAISNFFSTYHSKQTFWLGYSGGLDSRVLLALCARYHQMTPIQLKVIHIHHGLHPHADVWALHCADICKHYNFDFIEHAIQIKLHPGDSLEEIAREERYSVFANYMADGDVLLTAHQQDDQAETVLLQLLRGAGLKGLAAMPLVTTFSRGFHARPLLDFPRVTLQHYAEQYQLKWIDDPSNEDHRFMRNYIRQEILPRLKQRWPKATHLLARSAAHCAEAQVLLEDMSKTIRVKTAGSQVNTLSVAKLLHLDQAKQRLVLRTWLSKLACLMPDQKKLTSICQTVLLAKHDRTPCVRWHNVELRRFRDDLYLVPQLLPHDTQQVLDWDMTKPLSMPGLGMLTAVLNKGNGLRVDIKRVSVRFRCGGEAYHLGKRGKQYLKNLFQEWGVPPWERNRIPLIFVGEQLAMVLGYYLADDFAVKQDEMGYEIGFVTGELQINLKS